MKFDRAFLGWSSLAAIVALADYYGERTMSEAFRAASQTRYGRPVMIAVWTTLTLHLFGLLPERRDPFCLLMAPARRARGRAVIRNAAGCRVYI